MENQEPIRIAQIIGKWLGGGVESVVVKCCMETLFKNFTTPCKIRLS